MKQKVKNNSADIKNPNKGTNGQNITWSKRNGNRGAQLNPKKRN